MFLATALSPQEFNTLANKLTLSVFEKQPTAL